MMISIIIPIYNAEDTLNTLVHDIRAQDYSNYQVLLIDDGSTDKSADYGKEIQDKDRRFHYIYQENSGVSIARNHGLQLAEGEYITFLDADDRIDYNYLSALLNSCNKYNSDMAVCNVKVERDNSVITEFSLEEGFLSQKEALDLLLSRKKINSGPCAKLFKKRVLQDLAFPKLTAYEDILFVKDAICNAIMISTTGKTSYHYIENTQGAMSKFITSPTMDIIVATENLMNFIKDYKSLDSQNIYKTLSHLMQYVIPLYSFRENDKVYEFIINAKQLIAKYRKDIMFCPAFPWKEKIVFELFSMGYLYTDSKIRKYIIKK